MGFGPIGGLVGGIGGALAGGPVGAAIGGALGSGLGGMLDAKSQQEYEREMAERNINLQREFAQNGIRWKVEDAVKAGLHPLYALGASTQSFSPVSAGSNSLEPMDHLANMGQDITRAVASTRTAEERQMAGLQLQSARLDIEGKALDNQIRASQLQKMAATGPAVPSNQDNFVPGQGNSGKLMNVQPVKRGQSQPGALHQEAGWRQHVSQARTKTGLMPVIPDSLSESLEDDTAGHLLWTWRNRVMPNFGGKDSMPPLSQLPRGFGHWGWSHKSQEWQPRRGPAPSYKPAKKWGPYGPE